MKSFAYGCFAFAAIALVATAAYPDGWAAVVIFGGIGAGLLGWDWASQRLKR